MPPSSSTVKYEVRDRVAWITLNRPEAMNALSSELQNAIGEAAREATNDDDVLVVVVTGEGGRAFCAGMDLKERARLDTTGGQYASGLHGGTEIWNCPKPVIAAIDGYCLAGGMQLAARCDIRIATEKSRFGMPEPRRSLAPAGIVDTPEQLVPRGEALWIMLTGSHMTAQRAYDIGLIQAIVPDRDALFAEVERVAGELKLCAPLAVQALKRTVQVQCNLPTPPQGVHTLDHVRELVAEYRERIEKSEDRLEGPRAFAEKRAPNWKGR